MTIPGLKRACCFARVPLATMRVQNGSWPLVSGKQQWTGVLVLFLD